jgi:hypothetical protein
VRVGSQVAGGRRGGVEWMGTWCFWRVACMRGGSRVSVGLRHWFDCNTVHSGTQLVGSVLLTHMLPLPLLLLPLPPHT